MSGMQRRIGFKFLILLFFLGILRWAPGCGSGDSPQVDVEALCLDDAGQFTGGVDGVAVYLGEGLAPRMGIGPAGLSGSPAVFSCPSTWDTTLTCLGGGSLQIHSSCEQSFQSLEGTIFSLVGRLVFNNCGEQSLNGPLNFAATVGAVPFSCLAQGVCPTAVPLQIQLRGAESSFFIGATSLDGLLASFVGQLLQGKVTGDITEITFTSNGTEFEQKNGVLQCGTDLDQDGLFDKSDNCPTVTNPSQNDMDGDGVGNVCDNCLKAENPDQLDTDGDRIGDACDDCPFDNDPNIICGGGGNGIFVCSEEPPPPECVKDTDCLGHNPEDPTSDFCGSNGMCIGHVLNCDFQAFCETAVDCPSPGNPDLVAACTAGRCCEEEPRRASSQAITAGDAPPPPGPIICESDKDCPEGQTCEIPGGETQGKCAVNSCAGQACQDDAGCCAGHVCKGEGEARSCAPLSVCGNCLLEVGEGCEPEAVPEGPGTCGIGLVCNNCQCEPEPPPPPPEDPCIVLGSVTCDPETGLIQKDGLPSGIQGVLGESAVCGDLYLGACQEVSEGPTCCSPGVCGNLSGIQEGTAACGLYELVFNASDPENPRPGEFWCGEFFNGTCNSDGCCEASQNQCPGPNVTCEQAAGMCGESCVPGDDPCQVVSEGAAVCDPEGSGCCVPPPSQCPGPNVTCEQAAGMCGRSCVPGDDPCQVVSEGAAVCDPEGSGCCIPAGGGNPCGDTVCDSRGGEDCQLCPEDCGACPTECGNFICEPGETCADCSGDCGACPVCGNTLCEFPEDNASCPRDCPPPKPR